MKVIIILTIIQIVCFPVFSQSDSLNTANYTDNTFPVCEYLTSNSIKILTEDAGADYICNQENFGQIMDEWINECGFTEVIMRLIILDAITKGDSTNDLIEYYIDNEYDINLRQRQNDSGEPDYNVYYEANKDYYGYVPINHKIDTILCRNYFKVLDSLELSTDEKLLCYLFTGQIKRYDKEVNKLAYKESYIRNFKREKAFNSQNEDVIYSIVTGIYTPLKLGDNIFSTSPMLGFTMNSPLEYKLSLEIDFKVRLNINDQNFDFYALGDTNNVNSDFSASIDALFGYKIFDRNYNRIIPKIGAGWEIVGTGIKEDGGVGEDDVYYNIETLHLAAGITFMRPFLYGNYLGLSFFYHYTPYKLEKDLYTDFHDHSFSCEFSIFF